MASKLRLITDLYGETLTQISKNPDDWMSFLECAAMNYKYPFNDQVLIYAQRPEAVACAKIEAWNKQVGRWVNRGAKGIALLSEDNGYTNLRYVFDIADTNSKFGKSFRLWSVPKPYEVDIIESLENKYGELEDKSSLGLAIKSVSKIIVEDNMRGIPVGVREDGMNSLTAAFLIPHSGGKHQEGAYSSAVGINGEGNKIVCHTAEWLEVQVMREGKIWFQRFESNDEGAQAVTEVQVIGQCGESTGTLIKYKPDAKVYNGYFIDVPKLKKMLEEISLFTKGLTI